MKYLKTTQYVPGKGNAETYYECEDDHTIRRFMTIIPQTGEIERITKPVVKKLFRPEMCEPCDESEFREKWGKDE